MEKVKQKTEPNRNIFLNSIKAFFTGGTICVIAQLFIEVFKYYGVENKMASSISIAILVVIGSILTGFGIYDKIGQFGGCGSIIPITGFANSMASSALESKSEGLFLGILVNMFKLAGSVIATGVISAYIIGTIRYLLGLL